MGLSRESSSGLHHMWELWAKGVDKMQQFKINVKLSHSEPLSPLSQTLLPSESGTQLGLEGQDLQVFVNPLIRIQELASALSQSSILLLSTTQWSIDVLRKLIWCHRTK